MSSLGESNATEKKTKTKSVGWFPFSRSKKKCRLLPLLINQGTPVEVSKPSNFQKVSHVEIDPNSELGMERIPCVNCVGLKGLPNQWEILLKSSNISKEMAMKNKEALVDCLSYMEEHSDSVPLPKKEEFIADLKEGLLHFAFFI